MRSSGILMHITSLPGPYGVGTMGKEAYRFVDFLEEAGQSYWQILPLTPTGYGDSPYQSCSTYAGNHLMTWICWWSKVFSGRRRSPAATVARTPTGQTLAFCIPIG